MIEVKNISKSYGSINAVKDLSFTVNKGEVVGLLGPNGAGKTTTLNVITGVLMPDHGEVWINEQNLHQSSITLKKSIGYLAEDNPLYKNMLVSEFLKISAELKGLDYIDFNDEIDRIVKEFGIKEVFYRPISELSKGLRQRVGLAQAMISDPNVLILDEPTEGLDPNQRQEIRRLITELGRDHTVLLSTHVMQEVEAICEKVIILNKGEIVATGLVSEITQVEEGKVKIEFCLKGDINKVVSEIENDFNVVDKYKDYVVVEIGHEQQDDFYKRINSLTDDTTYLTKMIQKQVNLEEIFSKLTKDT